MNPSPSRFEYLDPKLPIPIWQSKYPANIDKQP
jgi:hypothetical protein